jgi:hypothetical protein
MEVASPAQEEPREPIRGANVFKLPPTDHDSARVICLVRGSPFDSVRPRQTHCPCLGVKGSQVQILSSRPTPGPLTLDKTPRQRAFFLLSVDLFGFGTPRSCGPFGDQCAVCEVDPKRGTGLSTGPFPWVASRTRRASHPGTGLSTSPVMVVVMVHLVAGHGLGIAVPR